MSKNDFSNSAKMRIEKSLIYLDNSLLTIKIIQQKLKGLIH